MCTIYSVQSGGGLPMVYSTPEQLSFHPIAGHTVRADFEGGALSSDFGVLLLRGIDRQIGLTARLAAAIHDTRHPSYIDHPLRDLLAQRIYQIASGYADGNDANSLRRDPLFKLGVERPPLAPEQDLASAPTFSRLEHRVDRKDLYRRTQALGAHFVASYPEPPAAIVLDLDHTDDPTHGQQELAFDNHYDKNYCYLPLLIFEGFSGALVTACLRPGTRPTGAENAMILVRLLTLLRRHWPQTHILVRGDSHFATPEVIEVLAHRHLIDVVFGLAGHPVLLRHAEPVIHEARHLHQQRTTLAQAHHARPPDSSRLYAEFAYAAASWDQPWRVILKAEVMAAGDNPRFVVTSLAAPTPQQPPSWRTPCGSSWRVPPMSCIMPSAPLRSNRPRSLRPNPRRSFSPSSKWQLRSNSTRTGSSSTFRVPAPSKRCCSVSRPCCLSSHSPASTRREVADLTHVDRPLPIPRYP